MKKQLKNGIYSYTVSFTLVVVVAIIKFVINHDIMGWTWFSCEWLGKIFNEKGYFSAWPLSHFILYMIIGYTAPDYWWLWLIIGIIWEFIEFGVGYTLKSLCKNEGNVGKVSKLYKKTFISNDQYTNQWYTGRYSDILFNSFGLLIGVAIAKSTKNKTPEKELNTKRRKNLKLYENSILFPIEFKF